MFVHVKRDGTFGWLANVLPSSAERYDTGRIVVDVARWSTATGWYDAETFNAADVPGLTAEQREQLTEDVAAARARVSTRRLYGTTFVQQANQIKDRAQNYTDMYSPGPDSEWPQPAEPVTAATRMVAAEDQIAVLRTFSTTAASAFVDIANGMRFLYLSIADLLEQADTTPPEEGP